jgi:CRISPR-associated endonuclease Cas2
MRKATREKLSQIGKLILTFLVLGGVATLAVMAPNIFSAWGKLSHRRSFSQKRLRKTLENLERRGLVKIREEDGETIVEITEKGKKRVLKYKIEEMKIKIPDHWDQKWRLVIFDVPEKMKLARNVLRDKLKELGFLKIQKSVWLFPYECKDEIDFIKEVYQISPCVLYLVVESIDNEEKFKKQFGLS